MGIENERAAEEQERREELETAWLRGWAARSQRGEGKTTWITQAPDQRAADYVRARRRKPYKAGEAMNAKEREFVNLAIYHLRNAIRELEDALGDPKPDPPDSLPTPSKDENSP